MGREIESRQGVGRYQLKKEKFCNHFILICNLTVELRTKPRNWRVETSVHRAGGLTSTCTAKKTHLAAAEQNKNNETQKFFPDILKSTYFLTANFQISGQVKQCSFLTFR
jgi:hypothetical protein